MIGASTSTTTANRPQRAGLRLDPKWRALRHAGIAAFFIILPACGAPVEQVVTANPPVNTVALGDRQHVATVLGRHFGMVPAPKVSFMRDSTHLNIQLDTAGASQMSDASFETHARSIASVALRAYEGGALVDSVTVAVVDVVVPNVAVRMIRHRTFPASILRP